MNPIYVVVKETGEYSHWDKENIAYFTTLEEADQYVSLYQSINDIHKKDDIYSVETILMGTLPKNAAEMIEQERQEVFERHAYYESLQKEALEKRVRALKQKSEDAAKQIYDSISEWDAVTNPQQKQELFRSLQSKLPTLMQETDDIGAIQYGRTWQKNVLQYYVNERNNME